MLKIATVAQTRQIEAAAAAAGFSYAQLMQNAGRATARRVLSCVHGTSPQVLVLVGKGNNGGDGLVAARIVAEESDAVVTCYLLHPRDDDPLLQAAHEAGVQSLTAEADPASQQLSELVQQCQVILDTLFGIGIQLTLRDPATSLLQQVRSAIEQRRFELQAHVVIDPARTRILKSRPYIIAVDCPSGLDCDSGAIDDHALPADETVTFIAAKPGLLSFPGAASVGRLYVATIGIAPDLPELAAVKPVLTSANQVQTLLPVRSPDANKGTFGKVLIVGGSQNYRGAVGLSGRAAYRVGAGLVTVATDEAVVDSLAGSLQELTWIPHSADTTIDPAALNLDGYDTLLMGPGWGRSPHNNVSQLALLQAELPPLIIDADGLNLLSEIEDWWTLLPPNTIITPHPGEMARLSGLSIAEIQANRLDIAAEKAAAWNLVLILKGAHTIIAGPEGQLNVLPFKTDALAKAGTGDVLAGTAAGFLAQNLDAYDAAVVAGFVHGLAGTMAADYAGSARSLLAGEVAEALGEALSQIEAWSVIET